MPMDPLGVEVRIRQQRPDPGPTWRYTWLGSRSEPICGE
jgi:hypothetical protein